MPKRALKLHVRIPAYNPPRNSWRRRIHAAAAEVWQRAGIQYTSRDRLEVDVRLYFDRRVLRWHDLDNRLKDVLDAL